MRDLFPVLSLRDFAVRSGRAGAAAVLVLIGAPTTVLALPQAVSAPAAPATDPDRAEAARLEAEAIALRDAGDFAEADRRIAELIAIELRLYGPDSDLVANSHGFRADLAIRREDLAAAARYLGEELAIRERRDDVGGSTAVSLRLVEVLTQSGRLADAEAQLRGRWGVFTRTFSPTLPMARAPVDGVVLALARAGEGQAAERLLSDLVAGTSSSPLDRERWMMDLGDRLSAAGQPTLGLSLLKQAADLRVARRAEPAWLAQAWDRLADAQGLNGDWPDAARSRRLALAAWEQTRPRENSERASAYLGRALLEAGESEEAYRRLSAAHAAFQRRVFSDDDRAYAAVHLARAALETGRDDEGDRLSLEAMRLRSQGAAANSEGLRLATEVRAEVMIRRNRLDEADALLMQARRLALTEDPAGGALSVIDSRLAHLRGLQGRSQDAETLARASIEDVATRHGPRSPQMVIVLSNLATHLSNANQFDRALPLVRQAADIQREVAAGRTEGPEARELLNMEYKLGRILGATGRRQEGLDLLQDVHRRATRTPGTPDSIVVDSGVQAAYLMMQLGRLSDAEAQLRKMARLAEGRHGRESYELIDVLQLHSASLYGLGRYEECLVVMRRVLAISEAAAPRWPRTRIDVMTNTAMTMIELDRTDEALDLLRRAGVLALERNARAGASGAGETAMSRQPFAILVRAAWRGAHGA